MVVAGYIGAQLHTWASNSTWGQQALYATATAAVGVGACVFFHGYKQYEATLHEAMIEARQSTLDHMKARRQQVLEDRKLTRKVTRQGKADGPGRLVSSIAGLEIDTTAHPNPTRAEEDHPMVEFITKF